MGAFFQQDVTLRKVRGDKVLVFVVLREKMRKWCNCKSNPNPNPNFLSRLITRSGIIERHIVVKWIWFNKRTYSNDNATTLIVVASIN